jgi:hypothetical protein
MPDEFHVEPKYLSAYAGQIDRNAGCFDQISAYLSANADKTDQMGGLLDQMAVACGRLLNWQLGILARMRPELAATAAALTKTAGDYTHTDRVHAARLDQTYPAATVPSGRERPL